MKINILKWFVLLVLALVGSTIWIYSTNVIVLIPLFALYAGIGRSEAIIFALMSCVPTFLYGSIYVLILLFSYIIYLLIYKISSMVFLDDVDCAMVSSFISVFMLCIERKTENFSVGIFIICMGVALLSFWLYFIFYLIKDVILSYVGDKKFKIELNVYQSSKNNDYCGDCYDYFVYNNKRYVLFSDGMYVGKEAFDLSSNVLSSIRCGIENGVVVNDVIKGCSKCFSNSYKCESFSTLDLMELSGNKLSLIKRGAENSLLIRNKDVARIESDSLPIGIDSDNSVVRVRIKDNDVLLMYSDGVKEKYPLFEAMVKDRLYGNNLNKWIKKLVCERGNDQKDDMSVLVIKFVDIS